MNCDYSPEEVKEIVEAHRDGESLEEFQRRLSADWIDNCLRKGLDPAEEIKKAYRGRIGTKRTD